MLDRPQVVCLFDLAQEAGVAPGRLHRIRRDQDAGQRQRLQQRPEVADLAGLAGLGHLVLADHQPGDMGDGAEQVHLLLPAGLGELALLAIDRDRRAGGHVAGVTGDGGVQPGVAGRGPRPAARP
jgi:hypothetical protein